MYVRPVNGLDEIASSRGYVRDPADRHEKGAAPQSLARESLVAAMVSELVFGDLGPDAGLDVLKEVLLGLLVQVRPVADVTAADGDDIAGLIDGTELERRPYIVDRGRVFVLPHGRDDVPLRPLLTVVTNALSTHPPDDRHALAKRLITRAGNRSLSRVVFTEDGHTREYIAT